VKLLGERGGFVGGYVKVLHNRDVGAWSTTCYRGITAAGFCRFLTARFVVEGPFYLG
jgi:hypothetical protein